MVAKNTKRRRRFILLVCSLALVGLIARPAYHLLTVASKDVDELMELPPGYIDDASRMNLTEIAEIWSVPSDGEGPEQQAAEHELAALLSKAKAEGLCVSVAGARHSMGGHTIYPGGIVVDMSPWNRMTLDEAGDILHVQAGAIWKDIIAYLDQRGRSVAIMQSNNSFSVGGSISVNCHGWQYGRPPIASSVESFRIMLADGSIVDCSRTENAELFSLALGGYGLFGIILDVDLRVVPNRRYRLEQYIVPTDEALAIFDAKIKDRPEVDMAYARMNIASESFLEDVIINAFVVDPDGEIPELTVPGLGDLRRAIFRGSADSDYGKELRWNAEIKLQPMLSGKIFSRNQLQNESVEVFQNRSAETTDILHEYFVPRHRVAEFVALLRKAIPEHQANLLNVTVRDVNEDTDTILRYADQPMTAFVMLFLQDRNEAGELQMQSLTRELIESALNCEGRYYLPYRLHATQQQFEKSYPQSQEFFALKLKYDPEELFQNQFYLRYGKPTGGE